MRNQSKKCSSIQSRTLISFVTCAKLSLTILINDSLLLLKLFILELYGGFLFIIIIYHYQYDLPYYQYDSIVMSLSIVAFIVKKGMERLPLLRILVHDHYKNQSIFIKIMKCGVNSLMLDACYFKLFKKFRQMIVVMVLLLNIQNFLY